TRSKRDWSSDVCSSDLLVSLSRHWPLPIPFAQLSIEVAERLGHGANAGERVAEPLGTFLLDTYTSSNLLELSVRTPAFTLTPGDRPVASALARHQAQAGRIVANLRHEQINLGDPERQALMLLDGTVDRATLADRLDKLVESGVLAARHEGQPVTDQER